MLHPCNKLISNQKALIGDNIEEEPTEWPTSFTILAVAGSLRKGSFNRMAVHAAEHLLPVGARLNIFDRLGEFPLFNQDH